MLNQGQTIWGTAGIRAATVGAEPIPGFPPYKLLFLKSKMNQSVARSHSVPDTTLGMCTVGG